MHVLKYSRMLHVLGEHTAMETELYHTCSNEIDTEECNFDSTYYIYVCTIHMCIESIHMCIDYYRVNTHVYRVNIHTCV